MPTKAGNAKPGPKPAPDARFSFMSKDPRYRKMPKVVQKVKVDARFKGMFTDKRFKTDYVVDKVGRKIKSGQGDDLRRLYEVESDGDDEGDDWVDQDDEGDMHEEDDDDGVDIRGGQAILRQDEEEEEEDEGDEQVAEDSTTSDSDVDSDVEADLAAWDEAEQKEAEKQLADLVEGDATARLAVMNMDWDLVKAVDILVMLNSFLPPGSHINKVTVYPSDFGLAQMAKEATSGPSNIWKEAAPQEEELGDVDDDVDQEKLREYENQRLRYYYAVVDCDSINAARALYNECDGLEMEATHNILDIRYIPEGTTFENTPRDSATKVPTNYKVSKGLRKGLQHTKLECSWDQEDPIRASAMSKLKQKKWSKDAEMEDDLAAYLGSDSSDGYGTDAVTEAEDEEGGHVLKRKARSKFKDILNSFKDNKEEEEAKMFEQAEIVFKPGLSEKGADILEAMEKKKALASEGVWETKVRLRAEALKAKKKRRKEAAKGNQEEDEGDDDNRGLTKEEREDPFFAEVFDEEEEEGVPKKKPTAKKQKKRKQATEPTEGKGEKESAELELLLMDEEKGFSLKDMVKKPQTKTQTKKAKKQKQGQETEESTVNVKDPRFEAIFTNPDLAIDPTHHLYKPTAGMEKLLSEKRRRTDQEQAKQAKQATLNKERAKAAQTGDSKESLASLVASVKQKAANFKPKSAPLAPLKQSTATQPAPPAQEKKLKKKKAVVRDQPA